MAFAHCAPVSLSCAHFMAKHTYSSSSSLPFQWQRSRLRSAVTRYLPTRRAIRVPALSMPYKSLPEIKIPPRSVKVASSRSGELAVVTRDTWDECVLNSEVPVLVEFWAPWCGPCRMVHREIEEIAEEYIGRLNCYMLKADEDIDIADKYGVKVVPVVLLFKNGAKCDSITGTMPNHVYVAAIEKLLS